MKINFTLTCLLLLFVAPIFGQIGGSAVFNFLSIPNSARVTALGSHHISALDDDVNLAFNNPALLNPEMHQRISFSHQFYLTGIGSGYAAYGHHIENKNATVHGSFRYVSYGDLIRTDPNGNEIGTFNASDIALTFGAGKQLYDRMRVGANLRIILGQLEDYSSAAIAADLGALYRIEEKEISIAFVIQNLGTQLSAFDDTREELPLDVQLAFTKRLKYLPFQFTVIGHQLHRWDIRYDDPNVEDEPSDLFPGAETTNEPNPFVDNLFRHLVFNGELFIGANENFKMRLGYNHLRKQELSIENFKTLAGFSFGFGFKVNKFHLDYGFGRYHIGGAVNHLTISTSIKSFTKNGITD